MCSHVNMHTRELCSTLLVRKGDASESSGQGCKHLHRLVILLGVKTNRAFIKVMIYFCLQAKPPIICAAAPGIFGDGGLHTEARKSSGL